MPDRIRIVSLAKLVRRSEQVNIFQHDMPTDVRRALSPELSTERYNRRWHFSQPVELGNNLTAAKLGFERVTQAEVVHYDNELRDFITERRPSEVASFCHFVVDTATQYMVFEERPPDIRRQSFVGAIRALLHESPYNVTVELVTDPAIFEQWVAQVRLVRFAAILRRPNPKWKDDVREIRELIVGTNADRVSVGAQVDESRPDAQLRIDSIIREAIRYGHDGYADYRAVGLRENQRVYFRSRQNVPTADVPETDEDTSESIWGKLRTALVQLSAIFQ